MLCFILNFRRHSKIPYVKNGTQRQDTNFIFLYSTNGSSCWSVVMLWCIKDTNFHAPRPSSCLDLCPCFGYTVCWKVVGGSFSGNVHLSEKASVQWIYCNRYSRSTVIGTVDLLQSVQWIYCNRYNGYTAIGTMDLLQSDSVYNVGKTWWIITLCADISSITALRHWKT